MKVSVPLQGTYLPYSGIDKVIDLCQQVSVPLQGTYLPYEKPFNNKFGFAVSVPLQGTYLPYRQSLRFLSKQ